MAKDKIDLKLELLQIKLSLHEAEVRIDKLERNSLKKNVYEEIDSRVQVVEAFVDNIKLIEINREDN